MWELLIGLKDIFKKKKNLMSCFENFLFPPSFLPQRNDHCKLKSENLTLINPYRIFFHFLESLHFIQRNT